MFNIFKKSKKKTFPTFLFISISLTILILFGFFSIYFKINLAKHLIQNPINLNRPVLNKQNNEKYHSKKFEQVDPLITPAPDKD